MGIRKMKDEHNCEEGWCEKEAVTASRTTYKCTHCNKALSGVAGASMTINRWHHEQELKANNPTWTLQDVKKFFNWEDNRDQIVGFLQGAIFVALIWAFNQ
jgi:hypothetical protein